MCFCCLLMIEMDRLEVRKKPFWHGASVTGAGNAGLRCPHSVWHLVSQGSTSPGTPGLTGWQILRSNDSKRDKDCPA